jgi:hypothetical protein
MQRVRWRHSSRLCMPVALATLFLPTMTETTSSSWRGRQRGSRRRSGQPRIPRGAVVAALIGADAPAALRAGARTADVPPTTVAAQTSADAPVAGLTEIAAFTGGAALPPRTGTMVTLDPGHCQGRRSRRRVAYPHQDQLRRVDRGDEGTAPGAAHVGSSSVRRRRLLRDAVLAF